MKGERFHAKVRAFLHQHEGHVAIHKLRRNIALTLADVDELNWMLTESGAFDREKLDHAVPRPAAGLGVFVRSLVGLDHGAVNDALSDFLRDTTLSTNQIEFLNMVVEYLIRHGCLRRRSCSSHRSPTSHPAGRM